MFRLGSASRNKKEYKKFQKKFFVGFYVTKLKSLLEINAYIFAGTF